MTDAMFTNAHAAYAGGSPAGSPLFRIDRFRVPPAALPHFAARLAIIHDFLGTRSGCLFNQVVTRDLDGASEVLTIVAWCDEAAAGAAKAAVADFYALEGFDPAVFMAGIGIAGEFSSYRPLRL